eukprot:6893577-Prymnesium_polylepis.1
MVRTQHPDLPSSTATFSSSRLMAIGPFPQKNACPLPRTRRIIIRPIARRGGAVDPTAIRTQLVCPTSDHGCETAAAKLLCSA